TAEVTYYYKFRNDYLCDGITLNASGYVVSRNGGNFLYKIRKEIINSCDDMYSRFDNAASISKAVIVGDRSNIDGRLFTIFGNAGISHVLAISGLHVSIIASSLAAILKKFRINKRISNVIVSIIIFFYALIVGYSPSIIRAASMIIVMYIVKALMKDIDGFTLIFEIFLAFVLINPYSLCSSSLQLSFVCTIGIMITEKTMRKAKHGKEDFEDNYSDKYKDKNKTVLHRIFIFFGDPMLVSFSAAVFSFPILYGSFDTVSYITPISNVILVPLFSLATRLSMYAAVVYPIWSFAGKILAFPAGLIFELITKCCDWVYSLNVGRMSTHMPLMWIPLLFSIALILVVSRGGKHMKKVLTVTTAAFILSLGISYGYNETYKNDRVIIETSAEKSKHVYIQNENINCYFDLGGSMDSDCIFENGEVSLDGYVVVKLQKSSVNRFKRMTESLKVDRVYLPNPKNSDEILLISEIKELANRINCDIITYYEDCTVDSGEDSLAYVDVTGQSPIVEYSDGNHKVTVICGNYSEKIVSDVVVLMEDYGGPSVSLECEKVFMYDNGKESNILPDVKFDENCRITFKVSENKGYEYGN
ncbi:MAG: ComEC/Rec2 family competence protein, partial [Clostridiales bacterium]|nr:ComEC/Rec2 family competence protein [Candidatus Coliplasma equi]